jgi:hypothetical protein
MNKLALTGTLSLSLIIIYKYTKHCNYLQAYLQYGQAHNINKIIKRPRLV